MADSIRYPLDDERARLFDQALNISGENTKTKALDAALRHYVESFENLKAMKERGDYPSGDERDRWETDELRFVYYPRIRSTNETHQ